jgi:hypothetical protein
VTILSDDIPERDEIVRSTVITVFLTALFLIIANLFWAWTSSEVETPVTWMYSVNPVLAPVIEVFTMFLVFVFLITTIINLRLYMTRIRAGWLEVILIFIFVTAMAWFMFGTSVGLASGVLSLAFIGYLYLLQE